MKRSMLVVAILAAMVFGHAAVALAQDPPAPKPEQKAAGIDGNWNMSLEGPQGPMQIALVLKQDGTKVTGTLTSQMGETALQGTFEENKLAFSISFDGGSGPMEIYFAAELKEDGTLAGTLSGPMGDMPWVAERAK